MQDKAVQSRQEGQVIPLRALPSLPLISPPSGEAGRQSRAATCDSSRPGSSLCLCFHFLSLWFDKQGLALPFLLHIVWRERHGEASRQAGKQACIQEARKSTSPKTRRERSRARQCRTGQCRAGHAKGTSVPLSLGVCKHVRR